MHAIDRLTIKGYKSIRSLEDFEMRRLNVLIGANGAGKSNFVGFFRLMRSLIEQRLQYAVRMDGGADSCLFMRPKVTPALEAYMEFGGNAYQFSLASAADNRLVFASEWAGYLKGGHSTATFANSGNLESDLKEVSDPFVQAVFESISTWVVYHFHDTSSLAPVRRQHAINDNEYLREDASNLASFLYRMRTTDRSNYDRIRDTVRMAAPYFKDLNLRRVPEQPHLTQLEWLQADSDYPFQPHQMSDGTLRFVCLATALMQPSMPSTILFDEPELGLHPHALALAGGLFHDAARESQIIVSTQSASLLSEFEPDDIIVVERSHGESTFRRLDASNLSEWLEDYSLGELWQKNILGGRPKQDRFPDPVVQR